MSAYFIHSTLSFVSDLKGAWLRSAATWLAKIYAVFNAITQLVSGYAPPLAIAAS